jgi:D-aspartate ligase
MRRLDRGELPPAVVLGIDINGLTTARALARRGITVIGVDSKRRRYAGYSGALTVLEIERFDSPAFLDILESLAAALPSRPALFVTMDEHVKLLGAADQRIRDLFRIEYPTAEAVELLMNKQRFAELAQERGWPMPQTVTCTSESELRSASNSLRFPVILKPRIKNRSFRAFSPAKAFRCADPAALLASYRLFSEWEPEAIVQEWVSGTDSDIRFSFHYFTRELEELCRFEGAKIRQWLPECGSTASAVGVAVPAVADLSAEILRASGCVGFGSIEYKRDSRTGSYLIMEPTVGRTNLQVGVAIANGVDLVSRAYFHLVDRPYPGDDAVTWDRKWIILKSDLRSARHYVATGQLTWADYLRSLSGPKTFAVWRATDLRMMMGFAGIWARAPLRLLRRFRARAAGRRSTELSPPSSNA